MQYSIYISEQDYTDFKRLLPLIGKIIYSVDQTKQEEKLYSRFDELIKNNDAILNIPKENSEMQKPKTFKRTIRIQDLDVHIRTRKCGKRLSFELRYRRDGLNINASATDKEKAINKFTDKLNAIYYSMNSQKVPTNFHEFTTYYFENYRKRKVGKQTYRVDLGRYTIHIQPYLGKFELRQIIPAQCQEVIDKVLSSGYERTAQDVFSLLNGIFKTAIAHNLIDRNPLAILLPVSHEREHGKALTKAEELKLLELTAGTPYQLMFAVALYTGLRPNEFSTAHIEGEFIIAVNSKRKMKKVEYKKIPVTPMLRPYLDGVTELKFYIVECIREKFRSILPNHKLYDLRTTFYTRCQECGVSDVARMEFVGHSLGKLGNAYTDLSDEYLLKEGNKLKY